jgi:ring-1,2-phenylacetyl-CoA epoxidase subunit PaaC
MQKAVAELWPYTGEMFVPAAFETDSENRVYISLRSIKNDWLEKVKTVLEEATIDFSDEKTWMQSGGKDGIHTEHLGYILAEMQFLQRAYPGLKW